MGRFASTVEFYARYREPYSQEFFRTAGEQLALRGDEALLDIGCGPAPLAIGFAPFVASCTGLDPEPGMIEAARAAVEQARVGIMFHLARWCFVRSPFQSLRNAAQASRFPQNPAETINF